MSLRMLLIGLAAGAASLAVASPVPLTETEAVHMGLGLNGVAGRDQALRAAAEADLRAASQLPNPTLHYGRERLNGTPGSTESTWMLEQVVDLSGRRGRVREAALRRVDAVEAGTASAQAAHAAETRRLFFAVLAGQERLDAGTRQLESIRRIEVRVAAQVRKGEAAGYDARRLARERQGAEANRAQAEAALARDAARLASRIGVSTLPRLAGELIPPPLPPLDAVLASLDDHPRLVALSKQAAASALEAHAARRAVWSQLSVGLGVRQVESGGVRESGPTLALALPLPVFDRHDAARQRAEAEAAGARAEMTLLHREIVGELRGRHAEAEALRQAALDYTRSALAATPGLLATAEAAWRGGETGLLDLIDAYRAAYDAEMTAIELAYAARQARIEFDLATGSAP